MISVFGSRVGEEELAEIKSCLDAQWMGIGPKTRAFEGAFVERLALPGFAMLDSGSNSLLVAVRILNLPSGSEVILPSFTWISCAHAVVLSGCIPVFCDVDLDTHNVTAETIAPHITPRTRALMVVHYAGKPVNMDPVLGFGLPVIEDAAHAVDSKLGDRYCGAIGDIGIYSFDPVKNLASCEAGGITAKNPTLIEYVRTLRYCGIGKSGFEASVTKDRWWEYNIVDFFPKMLPSDVSAAICLAQLRKLDALQARRRAIWDRYQKEFQELGWLVRPQDAGPGEQHSYFTYCVRVANGRRDAFAKFLLERDIYTTLRYHPLHMNPIYRSSARLPACERLNEEALSLPIHPNLSDADLDRIVDSVKSFPA
jgi:aminotransferase